MSEVNNKPESKVEKKRLRGRNTYEVVNQIVESYNKSEGWSLKRVNMIGMNIEVHLERSADQNSVTKEVSNAKQVKKETVKASETQAQSKEDNVDAKKDKPVASSKTDNNKPTTKRSRATTKK